MRLSTYKANLLAVTVMLLSAAAMWFIPSPKQLASDHGVAVRAKVLSVDNSTVQMLGLLRYGSQHLTVEILEGVAKGKTYHAVNEIRAQMDLDKDFHPGDTAVVVLQNGDDAQDSATLIARDQYRMGWGWILFGGFCVLLCAFGGWVGVKALFSFLYSCIVIWKAVIPLALHGWPVSWTVFAAVCWLTAVIMYLVAGLSRKGVSAFLGASVGVLAGLGLAHTFGRLMKINGATMPYVQSLLYSGFESLNLQDVFIGAMVLASSGAVMDLAMDIASGIDEVARHNPELSGRELCLSGLRIGRSVVGTMTTTLLLAYSGGYITLLMVFCTQGTHPLDFLNNALVASEVVKTLIGSFSLIFVAPSTALIAAWIFSMKKTVR